MKKAIVIGIWIIAVLVALAFVKDLVIKVAVEKGVELVTGLKIEMKGFSVGIIRSVVSIKDLKVYNPKSFPEPVMIDIPEIYVDYDLPAMIGGKIHLRELRIHLKELNVVKNSSGELNLNSLKVVKAKNEGKPAAAKEGGMPSMQIDVLELKAGKATYKDYSAGTPPSVKEFNVNLDERYTNINNPYALVGLLIVKTLSNTAIGNLANFDVGGLSNTVTSSISTATNMASNAAATAKATVAQTQTAVKEASGTLQKTAEDLSNVFKSPFGSEKK